MSKIILIFIALITVGCGPDLTAREGTAEKRGQENAEKINVFAPVAGLYRGEMITRSGKIFPVELEVVLYSMVDDSRGGGEESTIPMLRASLVEATENNTGITFGVYSYTSYTPSTGALRFYRDNANGIDAVFSLATADTPDTITGVVVTPLAQNRIRVSRYTPPPVEESQP